MAKKPTGMKGLMASLSNVSAKPENKDAPQEENKPTEPAKRKPVMERKISNVKFEEIDPKLIRVWEHPNRRTDLLTEENCSELIHLIRDEGQQEPIIVRETNDREHPFEVVAGRRRHFVAQFLNRPVLARVRRLSDEEAWMMSEIENSGEPLSDYEEALNLQAALERYYGGVISTLSSKRNISRQKIRRYLLMAEIGPKIIDAYASMFDIKLDHAQSIKQFLTDRPAEQRLERIVKKISAMPLEKRSDGAAVFKQILSSLKSEKTDKKDNYLLNKKIGIKGNEIGTIQKTKSGGVVIKFNKKIDADLKDIKEILSQIIDENGDHFA